MSCQVAGSSGVNTTTEATGAELPHVVVVSYLAHAQFSPRAVRTQALVEALRTRSDVELIAGPQQAGAAGRPHVRRSLLRKTLNYAHSSVLLDRFEPWSWRRFHGWHPQGAGAILIGFPFSPLAHAARRLEAARVPYVVDVGDPWILTARGDVSAVRGVAALRARRSESRLWSGAAGAIFTTYGQRDGLRALFPDLPTLVRPNGFSPVHRHPSTAPRQRAESERILRLAHFGDVYVARLDVIPFLERLARGGWDDIELHQYGSDWTGVLAAQTFVKVVFHEPRPWAEVVDGAHAYDAALVIGNRDPTQLPSKAVAYLQLPIPRVALVADERHDALAGYVRDKPGWLVVETHAADTSRHVRSQVEREWDPRELAAPDGEAWESVARDIADFALDCLERAGGANRERGSG